MLCIAKLRSTLAHEMCHAAVWMLDHISKPPHGARFRYWGARVSRAYPDLTVKTCHAYEIFYKFRYQCESCSKVYGRHSDSIDVITQACGVCHGRLRALGAFVLGADGSSQSARKQTELTPFAKFVKEQYRVLKAANPVPNTPSFPFVSSFIPF